MASPGWRPGHPRRARRPVGRRGWRPGQPGDQRHHTDPAGHRPTGPGLQVETGGGGPAAPPVRGGSKRPGSRPV